MKCPHCGTINSRILPFSRPLSGGQAYAQTCSTCGHILRIRPHLETDPPAVPPYFNGNEAERLRFLKWRFSHDEPDPGDTPPNAA
jgi:hypothetical protein